MTNAKQRLPAEWEAQDAVLLIWPHRNTDWEWMLDDIIQLYEALVSVICDYADVVIALPAAAVQSVRAGLEAMSVPLEYVHFYQVDTRDIWSRDFGPVAVQAEQGGIKLLDFAFGGHGERYCSALNKQLLKTLQSQGAFPAASYESLDFPLQAGGLESDGQGTLLVAKQCLLDTMRNTQLSVSEVEDCLRGFLGVGKINYLENGFVLGGETDGHIDNLARLCPNHTIVYTACDDESDEHYAALKKMEAELRGLSDADGCGYRLLPLPWPGVIMGEDGRRLPASYASFAIVNECVLVPIYDVLSDEDAFDVISRAFPGLEILGIPSVTLLEQGGSLHRIIRQLPAGTLFAALTELHDHNPS